MFSRSVFSFSKRDVLWLPGLLVAVAVVILVGVFSPSASFVRAEQPPQPRALVDCGVSGGRSAPLAKAAELDRRAFKAGAFCPLPGVGAAAPSAGTVDRLRFR